MNWRGIWKNQYRSIVEITDDADNRIAGSFRTALVDSGFHGKEIPVLGIHHGDCISFARGRENGGGRRNRLLHGSSPKWKNGDVVVCRCGCRDTSVWRGDPAKIEKLNWWRSMSTSADTFQRE
jgi:hypothetical protein